LELNHIAGSSAASPEVAISGVSYLGAISMKSAFNSRLKKIKAIKKKLNFLNIINMK
jgi:hypothetical protein